MAARPGSGSDGGFFLLKGVFSYHSRLVHAQDGASAHREVMLQSVGFLSLATFSLTLSELEQFRIELIR